MLSAARLGDVNEARSEEGAVVHDAVRLGLC